MFIAIDNQENILFFQLINKLYILFFFFKQKTAYEIMPSLVGSEMCIRDSFWIPKGNRYVLPFNLAEMERQIYGSGQHFIHPGDIVLDCGASDGDFTRVALRAGAKMVVSIEVSPSSAECIRRNLAAEIAAGRVIVYPKGVWDRDDSLMLNADDTNFAANSVVIR